MDENLAPSEQTGNQIPVPGIQWLPSLMGYYWGRNEMQLWQNCTGSVRVTNRSVLN
jgi:hypothetical protein